MKTSVRIATAQDIPLITDYWLNATTRHLEGMGVDLSKLPDRMSFSKMLSQQILLPIEEKNSYCLIWELNNEPCGHANTNPTSFGQQAHFHTHLWYPRHRKLGFGSEFLKLTIRRFFIDLKLERLIGEPYAKNPGPNKLLEKLGFNFVKQYKTTPGSINTEQIVNRYEMKVGECPYL